MAYVLVTPPEEEPISLDEGKAWAKLDADDEDELVEALIVAARQYVERETNRVLVTQEWRLDLDAFPTRSAEPIRLAKGPVSEVTELAYRDGDDAAQTLTADEYLTDPLPADNPRLHPAVDTAWPDFQRQPGAVQITFTAGYGDAADVPDALKTAMKFLIAHWVDNRGAVGTNDQSPLAMAAGALMDMYRLPLLA